MRSRFEGRMMGSALLIGSGLVVDLMTLQGVGPTRFLLFVLGGSLLVVMGVTVFLWSVLSEMVLGGGPAPRGDDGQAGVSEP